MNVATRQQKLARDGLIVGGVLAVAGTTTLVNVLASHLEDDEIWATWAQLGMLVVLIGVFTMGVGYLARRNRPMEEAYRLGYDVGFENGFNTALKHEGSDGVVRTGPHDYEHHAVRRPDES